MLWNKVKLISDDTIDLELVYIILLSRSMDEYGWSNGMILKEAYEGELLFKWWELKNDLIIRFVLSILIHIWIY